MAGGLSPGATVTEHSARFPNVPHYGLATVCHAACNSARHFFVEEILSHAAEDSAWINQDAFH